MSHYVRFNQCILCYNKNLNCGIKAKYIEYKEYYEYSLTAKYHVPKLNILSDKVLDHIVMLSIPTDLVDHIVKNIWPTCLWTQYLYKLPISFNEQRNKKKHNKNYKLFCANISFSHYSYCSQHLPVFIFLTSQFPGPICYICP